MKTEIKFNQTARDELSNRCHRHDLNNPDAFGSTTGLISQTSIDNFARNYDLTYACNTTITEHNKSDRHIIEHIADWEKIERACNVKMMFLEDNLDYMYRVVFYNKTKKSEPVKACSTKKSTKKINKSELFKTAWQMAKEAVKNFGGRVREYFAEALREAWKQMKNTAKTIVEKLKNSPFIESYKKWAEHGHDRIYFTLVGYDKSYRGCRNFKLYFDNKKQLLIMSEGRGMEPAEFKTAHHKIYWEFEGNKSFKCY